MQSKIKAFIKFTKLSTYIVTPYHFEQMNFNLYPREKRSSYAIRTRCCAGYFKFTNKQQIRLAPVIYINFDPRLPSHFFVRFGIFDICFMKNPKLLHNCEDDRLNVLWDCDVLAPAYTRNSLKAKSKANNIHVLELFRLERRRTNERTTKKKKQRCRSETG